jgi:hypothetical protein
MMYNKKIVVAIKTGGKVLREQYRDGNSIVHLPFGVEYSLLLKNLSTQRALVNVEIDGRNVTDGGMIVDANREVNLERAINGDLNSGRKFKFIEKTEEISDFRGDRVDDGLLRITYRFERRPVTICTTPSWPQQWTNTTYGPITYGSVGCATGSSSRMITSCLRNSGETYKNDSTPIGAVNSCYSHDASGITVEGSKSNQSFTYGNIWNLEDEIHSMVFQLVPGEGQPVTVDRRSQCPTCGRKWKGNFEFCGNCGTALRK